MGEHRCSPPLLLLVSFSSGFLAMGKHGEFFQEKDLKKIDELFVYPLIVLITYRMFISCPFFAIKNYINCSSSASFFFAIALQHLWKESTSSPVSISFRTDP